MSRCLKCIDGTNISRKDFEEPLSFHPRGLIHVRGWNGQLSRDVGAGPAADVKAQEEHWSGVQEEGRTGGSGKAFGATNHEGGTAEHGWTVEVGLLPLENLDCAPFLLVFRQTSLLSPLEQVRDIGRKTSSR